MSEITERFVGKENGNLTPEREQEIFKFADDWGDEEFGCHEFTEQSAAYHYGCTREKDHPGPHIALGETEVFAIWDKESKVKNYKVEVIIEQGDISAEEIADALVNLAESKNGKIFATVEAGDGKDSE